MELLQLKYFKEAAECEKITSAAKRLYISAPSLSATIRRLETELGTELFDRTGNTVRLNRQGETFLRYVNQALTSLETGQAELARLRDSARRHVSIAATTSNLWVGLLSAFSLEFPRITISNTSLKLDQLLDPGVPGQYSFLLAEKNDFSRALNDIAENNRKHKLPAPAKKAKDAGDDDAFLPFSPDELNMQVLIRNDLPVLVLPKDHPAARLKEVNLADFREEKFLLPVANMSLHSMAQELLSASGVSGKNLSECSYMLRRQMILEHRGIAFSTEYTSRSEDQTMVYVPITQPALPQTHGIYWEAGRKLKEDEQIFLEFAAAYFSAGIL